MNFQFSFFCDHYSLSEHWDFTVVDNCILDVWKVLRFFSKQLSQTQQQTNWATRVPTVNVNCDGIT